MGNPGALIIGVAKIFVHVRLAFFNINIHES